MVPRRVDGLSARPRPRYGVRLGWKARLGFLLLACAWVAVFAVACRLDPFDATGQLRRHGTHEQLGLPPCAFLQLTGQPCATCGMTTAMSLAVRGQPGAAAKANLAGLLLAIAGLPLVGLGLAGAATGRWWGPQLRESQLLPAGGVVLGILLLAWLLKLAEHAGWF